MTVDLAQVKQAQREVWPTGDYQYVANYMNLAGASEALCDSIQVLPHHRVLDVATGTGNAALAAKRRGLPHVTGIDYAERLVEIARERAAADHLDITFEVGDAEHLPYPDNSFDIVISTLGVFLTPDQESAVSELLRVCRPGGRIGVVAWTPDGDIGTFNQTIAGYVAPPEGVPSPLKWGSPEGVAELFGDRVKIETRASELQWRTRSARDAVDMLATNFGPLIAALKRLDAENREALIEDLVAVFEQRARPAEGSYILPGNYLEAIVSVP